MSTELTEACKGFLRRVGGDKPDPDRQREFLGQLGQTSTTEREQFLQRLTERGREGDSGAPDLERLRAEIEATRRKLGQPSEPGRVMEQATGLSATETQRIQEEAHAEWERAMGRAS
jgi:hypothetical protein